MAVVHVHRAHLDAVLACIADQLRRGVEPHRLAVEDRGGEHVRIVFFQPGGHVNQQGEAGGMAFREPVIAEAFDLAETALGKVALVAVRNHSLDQFFLEHVNGAGMAEGGHGTAQLVGLGRGEVGGDDGDLHGLFLEQRHAMGFRKHVAQFFGRVLGLFLAVPAAQIGMHHVALDRAGADDGDFDDEIVERPRLQARQHGHLGAAFDLKDAYRIRLAQHVVDGGIAGRHGGELDLAAVMAFQQVEALADTAQHAERQHVDFQDAERVEVVLVPFDRGAVFHRRVGDGHHLRQGAAGDHEPADMLRQVSGKTRQFAGKADGERQPPVVGVEPGFADMFPLDAVRPPSPDRRDEGGRGVLAQPHGLADFADRHARAVMDDRGREPGAVAAVFGVNVLNDLFAAFVLEIDVDIGGFVPFGGHETFE